MTDHLPADPNPHRTHVRRRLWSDDTGSGGMALMLLVTSVALLMVLGLIIDGGGKARALDRADAIAAETARVAAGTYRPGDPAIDPGAANAAAADYLAAAGATGHIAIAGLTVTATAALHQQTVFLPLIGIDEFTVTGSGNAEVVYQQGGTP